MKIVVDTNILFSFFWSGSFTKKLLVSGRFDLISPEIALKEIRKYSKDIQRKVNISTSELNKDIIELRKFVRFVQEKEYSKFLHLAKEFSPDESDAHFFALCLKYECILWSKDVLLKNQNKIKVLSTEEIVNLVF